MLLKVECFNIEKNTESKKDSIVLILKAGKRNSTMYFHKIKGILKLNGIFITVKQTKEFILKMKQYRPGNSKICKM